MSPQMKNLMARYGVKNKRDLLRADWNAEAWEPGDGPKYTLRDADLQLDGMLEAEYQRIAGGAYDAY